jgi:energy-coupling factor transport system substrate-specific component
MFKSFSTRDLIIISTLAAIGIAIKPVVNPLFKMISAPLMVPGGSFAGGLYMMWLTLAIVLTRKAMSGILFGFMQAIIVMLMGMMGNQGAFSLISYFIPGVVASIVYWLFRGKDHCVAQVSICALANVSGAVLVALGFFHHPPLLVLIIAGMAYISGIVGGFLSYGLQKQFLKLGVIA